MKFEITVEGMSCEHCVMAVKKAIQEIPGVKGVEVDLSSKKATVEADDDKILDDVKEAIRKAGYRPA